MQRAQKLKRAQQPQWPQKLQNLEKLQMPPKLQRLQELRKRQTQQRVLSVQMPQGLQRLQRLAARRGRRRCRAEAAEAGGPAKFKVFYDEIDRVLPSIEYCSAAKKAFEKQGAASLRSAVVSGGPSAQSPEELDKHAAVLWKWLDTSRVSRIRMMMVWQASAGVSFVAATNHRAAQCSKYHGNRLHGDGSTHAVSLVEF